MSIKDKREEVDTTIEPATGMQRDYLVLSEEERAKGFVRPVRTSYVHVGRQKPEVLRDLTEEEQARYPSFAKFEVYPSDRSPRTGRFWTQAELDSVGSGCGGKTTMGLALAETYARNPAFYGGTFCAICRAHFPVGEDGEFVWDGTTEKVGT